MAPQIPAFAVARASSVLGSVFPAGALAQQRAGLGPTARALNYSNQVCAISRLPVEERMRQLAPFIAMSQGLGPQILK